MHYLTGCAKGFRIGYIDVNQFTLENNLYAHNEQRCCCCGVGEAGYGALATWVRLFPGQ